MTQLTQKSKEATKRVDNLFIKGHNMMSQLNALMCVQIGDFAVFVFRIFVIMQQVIFLYATLCIFHIQVESVILEIPYYSLNSDTA